MTTLQALTQLRNDALKNGYPTAIYTLSILRLLGEAIQDKLK